MRARGLLPLLERVSRSFYLTLRVLPPPVREPLALAYLLARATDSVADTSPLPVAHRRALLKQMGERIASLHDAPLDLAPVAAAQTDAGERELLTRFESLVDRLEHTVPEIRDLIRDVLATILSGQLLDVTRFGEAGPGRIGALETDAELEDYTYRVAGSVGRFWTMLTRNLLFPNVWLDFKRLLQRGVHFGQGLQRVNILRDLPADLRQGRCYLPRETLAAHGLAPEDLLDPAAMDRFRPLYTRHLDQTHALLAEGWTYTNVLPWRQMRLRLACAWPALIGARTLALLRTANVLDPARRLKIGRAEVRSLLLRSLLLYPAPPLWRRLFGKLPSPPRS